MTIENGLLHLEHELHLEEGGIHQLNSDMTSPIPWWIESWNHSISNICPAQNIFLSFTTPMLIHPYNQCFPSVQSHKIEQPLCSCSLVSLSSPTPLPPQWICKTPASSAPLCGWLYTPSELLAQGANTKSRDKHQDLKIIQDKYPSTIPLPSDSTYSTH